MSDGNRSFTDKDAQQLSRLASSVLQRLRTQRETLRQHGMDVPPGTIKNAETTQAELDQITARFLEQNNELERLRALVDTTALINSSLNLDQTLSTVMDTVIQLTRAERGYIMLQNPQTGEMEVRTARGTQHGADGNVISISQTIVQQVLNSGQPLVTTDALDDARFSNHVSIVGMSLRSILCVPLVIKSAIQGVVYADSSVQSGLFGNKELQLLVAVASQSALAIENARLFEQARATLEEITEIKTLLDNILASIASGVITTDAQNIVTTYNAGAEAILGIAPDYMYGQPFEAVLPEIYKEVREMLALVRTQNEGMTLEIESPLRNSLRNLNLKLSPLKDATQTTQGVALVVDDQTELKQRDAMLQAVRRYLPPAMVDNIKDIQNIGLGGERRLVTVIFVEVLPFASFQASLRAEELMELLNVYLTVGTEAIHRRKGLVDKYMGSEIMALFNTQLNPSDLHAWDAVNTAIEMMRDFHDLHLTMGENPNTAYYRMGVHTGVATLGNVGSTRRREFTAIGDTVNLAKRLQENASTGQLIISRETYTACEQFLRQTEGLSIQPRGTLQVKGREKEVEILEIKPQPR